MPTRKQCRHGATTALAALTALAFSASTAFAAAAPAPAESAPTSMWDNPGLIFAGVILGIGLVAMSIGPAVKERMTMMETRDDKTRATVIASQSSDRSVGATVRFSLPGPMGARTIEDRLPVTIGRDDTCGIVLNDAQVSGCHARVFAGPNGTVEIEDTRSTNGLFVDGRRIKSAPLVAGSTVLVGATTLRFEGRIETASSTKA